MIRAIFGIIVGFCLLVFVCTFVWEVGRRVVNGVRGESTETTEITPREYRATRSAQYTRAIVSCQMAVTERLKAPSTASFEGMEDVRDKGNGIALVIGSVDSQNGFGAMLRTRWICEVDVNDPKNGRVQSVVLGGP